jgi:hypothetical protein
MVSALSLQIYIRGFQPVIRYTNIILERQQRIGINGLFASTVLLLAVIWVLRTAWTPRSGKPFTRCSHLQVTTKVHQGDGGSCSFWLDHWIGPQLLTSMFPVLFSQCPHHRFLSSKPMELAPRTLASMISSHPQ